MVFQYSKRARTFFYLKCAFQSHVTWNSTVPDPNVWCCILLFLCTLDHTYMAVHHGLCLLLLAGASTNPDVDGHSGVNNENWGKTKGAKETEGEGEGRRENRKLSLCSHSQLGSECMTFECSFPSRNSKSNSACMYFSTWTRKQSAHRRWSRGHAWPAFPQRPLWTQAFQKHRSTWIKINKRN